MLTAIQKKELIDGLLELSQSNPSDERLYAFQGTIKLRQLIAQKEKEKSELELELSNLWSHALDLIVLESGAKCDFNKEYKELLMSYGRG